MKWFRDIRDVRAMTRDFADNALPGIIVVLKAALSMLVFMAVALPVSLVLADVIMVYNCATSWATMTFAAKAINSVGVVAITSMLGGFIYVVTRKG